jgi:hypothetical protein
MRYSTKTTVPPADVLRRAREVFGRGGAGLQLTSQELLSARFEGGGGFVAVEARRIADRTSEVLVETQEFDAEVRKFLSALPRPSAFGDLLVALRRKLKSNSRQ